MTFWRYVWTYKLTISVCLLQCGNCRYMVKKSWIWSIICILLIPHWKIKHIFCSAFIHKVFVYTVCENQSFFSCVATDIFHIVCLKNSVICQKFCMFGLKRCNNFFSLDQMLTVDSLINIHWALIKLSKAFLTIRRSPEQQESNFAKYSFNIQSSLDV